MDRVSTILEDVLLLEDEELELMKFAIEKLKKNGNLSYNTVSFTLDEFDYLSVSEQNLKNTLEILFGYSLDLNTDSGIVAYSRRLISQYNCTDGVYEVQFTDSFLSLLGLDNHSLND